MATQYSNKPIVTNGLVYALDFGNQKSYVSGSSSARSLVFNPTAAFVSGSPTFTATGLLNLSSTSNVLTNKTFSELTINNSYTVSTLVQVKGGGVFWNQDASPSADAAYLNPNSTGVGHLVTDSAYLQGSDFRRGFSADLTQLTHITYRNYSGSFDVFINGVPVNTTGDYGGMLRGSGLNLNGRDNGNSFWSGSIGNFYIYNRALNSDEIYSNYLITARRYGMRTSAKPYTVDENAYLFLSQSGITDPIITSSIDTFVKGLKANNLWGKMAVIYPFVGTGSVGVNLTGSHKINLKEPGINAFTYSGAWNGSTSGSAPSGSGTYIDTGVSPQSRFPYYVANNYHMSILSYDTPVSSSILAGTGMTKELAVSTLAGDYGTPAAAYSVRKVRTAYSGALMDVRRDYDNTTGSVGYVSNGDLDTGSLLDFVVAGRATLPGNYSGLAAAYSLRRVSSSYSGSAIDVRRIWDNTTSSIGFDASGNLDTGSLLSFTTSGSNILLNSNDFSSNAKYNVQVTSSAILGPFGLGSGSFINETNATSFHSFDYNINPVNTSSIHTISCFVKKQERRYIGLSFAYDSTRYISTTFDLDTTSSTATASAGIGYSVISSSINYVTDGWFRISLTGTAGLPDFYPRFYLTNTSAASAQASYSGQPGTGSYVYGFQYTTGSTLQPYIETTGTARYNVGNTSSFGYVTKWYDQSGNARHAAQTATGSQPLIVSSGSLVVENGKPAVQFDNIRRTRLKSPAFTGGTIDSSFLVVRTNVQNQVFLDGDTTNNIRFYNTPTANSLDVYAGNTDIQANIFTLNKQHLVSTIISGSNSILAVDNDVRTGINLGTNVRNGVTIGSHGSIGDVGNAFTGNFQEIVIFDTNQSASKSLIENNINTYYSIYTSSAAGYVAKWYDQSGNNNHATQSVTSSQPLIITSGSVISDNSRVGIYFDDTTFLQRGAINVTQAGQYTVYTPYGDTRYSVWGQDSGDAYWLYTGGTGYIDLFGGTNTNNRRESYPTGVPTTGPTLFSSFHEGNNMTTFINNSNRGTNSTQPFDSTGTVYIGRQRGGTVYSLSGSIKEIIVYNSADSSSRQSIEYGINNYYNLFPQTSSFSTSSFAIYATTSSISASINNDLQSGIASTGPLGFITVSRTGSNSLTLSKNGVTSSFSVPASGALSTNLYLGAINNNGLALGSSPYNISFASVGTGLTGADTTNLNRLVNNLKINTLSPGIVTDGLVLFLDAGNKSSYPGTGNIWGDFSGNNNNTTLINGPTFNSNNQGSIVFDGVNDYATVTTTKSLIVPGNMTYEIIFMPKASVSYAPLGGTDVIGSQAYFYLDCSNLMLRTYNETNAYASIAPVQLNNIYHFVSTRLGTAEVNYLNGALTTGRTSPLGGNNNGFGTIGGFPLLNWYWNCGVYVVRIYNRVLSASEVLQNYNATRGRFGI